MEIIVILIIIVAVVFVIRLFGAWMLRIDEVITNQKAILVELKKSNSKSSNESITLGSSKQTKRFTENIDN